jgi:hypothetical protein
MVFTTQRISLRAQSESYTSLTATHDLQQAWSSLGAATIGLFNQWKIPTHHIGVTMVLLYLSGIYVLHTTSGALLRLEMFSFESSHTIITRGIANYTIVTTENQLLAPGVSGSGATPVLFRMSSTYSPGLYGNIVYDIPDDNNATEPLLVHALAFNVSCQPVSNVNITFTGGSNFTLGGYDNLTCYGPWVNTPKVLRKLILRQTCMISSCTRLLVNRYLMFWFYRPSTSMIITVDQ